MDSSFFKADTVRLVKYVLHDERRINTSAESYTQNQDFIQLYFHSNGSLSVEQVSINQWEVTKRKGQYSWRFNNKQNRLYIIFNGKVLNSFTFSSKRRLSIQNGYNEPKLVETEEYTFIR